MRFWPRKHDWELIDKTILPSIEQVREKIAAEQGLRHDGDTYVGLLGMQLTFRPPDTSLSETLVLTFKCKLTNKVKVVKQFGANKKAEVIYL